MLPVSFTQVSTHHTNIHKNDTKPKIRIVFFTNSNEAEVMMKHQDPGADCTVVEPEDDGGDGGDVVDVESPLADGGGPGAHHPPGGPPAPRYRHKSHSQR